MTDTITSVAECFISDLGDPFLTSHKEFNVCLGDVFDVCLGDDSQTFDQSDLASGRERQLTTGKRTERT